MFKNLTLRLRNKSALKNNPRQFMSTPFAHAKKIGVLVEDFSKNKNEVFPLLEKLKAEGKKVDIINFINHSDIVQGEHIRNISKKSIDWKGKIKDDFVEKFLKTEYDYLFSLHTSSFLPFENILARSKAKCRVGQYIENKKAFLDIMIHPNKEESLKQRTTQMLEITKHT